VKTGEFSNSKVRNKHEFRILKSLNSDIDVFLVIGFWHAHFHIYFKHLNSTRIMVSVVIGYADLCSDTGYA